MKMDLGVDVLPKFSKDHHRPQPYLSVRLHGNKFEFRMPGSAENLSDCQITHPEHRRCKGTEGLR